ncbi:MAG: hypothetical protein RIE59_18320 [Imperialibacter sp.]
MSRNPIFMRLFGSNIFITIGLVMLFAFSEALAQPADSLRELLQTKGAENIQYFKDEQGRGHYTLEYRLHRNPVVLLNELSDWVVKSDTVALTLMWYGSPWATLSGGNVTAATKDDRSLRRTKPSVAGGWPYKLDISIAPVVFAEFGDEFDIFRTQLALAPKIKYLLPFGLSADVQWIFPIQNDFERRLGFSSRPGQVSLSYTKSFVPNHLFVASAGTFLNRQYGASADYVIRAGRNYFGVAVNLSASYAYDERVLYREPLEYVSGGVWWMHSFPQHDLWTKVSFERFLYEDYGSRIELFRQFGNNEMGLYMTASARGFNGGVQWAMPLFPKAFYRNKYVQVRPANQFLFTYEYLRNQNDGESLMKYRQTDRSLRALHPSFIKNHLLSLLKIL